RNRYIGNIRKLPAARRIIQRRSQAAHHLVIADVQEVLDLGAAAKDPSVFTVDPANVVGPGVILAIPNALAGILGVHVDGHHAVEAAFRPNLEARVAEIWTDGRNGGAWGDPGPPVAQPVEVEFVHQVRRNSPGITGDPKTGLQWPAGQGARDALLT